MVDILLFEISCAEQIGDYKLADTLDEKLKKMASTNHRDVIRKIERKFDKQSGINDVSFSNSKQVLVVAADAALPNSIKREITTLSAPYGVTFKYSQKNIDQLYNGSENPDPMDRHTHKLEEMYPGDEHIGLDSMDDIEPTMQDLDLEEVPGESWDDDPNGLDEFLLNFAREEISKQLATKDQGY